jgi:hypothetical protein
VTDGTDQVRPPRPHGPLLRYLARTHPAAIFIHAVILLLVGPFLNAAELWLQSSGAGYADYLSMTLDGDRQGFAIASEDGVNPLRAALIWTLRLSARIAITLGYALPIWAAARLIADTLYGPRTTRSDLPPKAEPYPES